MSAPYLKANLITELAAVAGISKRKTDLLLTQMAQIAYREARTGFILPGICKLDVVHRNARRARIPRTGEQIIIGAHDSLRVRPLRKAKHAVTPMHPGLVQYVRTEALPEKTAAEAASPAGLAPQDVAAPAGIPAPAPVQPAASVPTTAAPVPALQPNNTEGMVSFKCAACGQEMEAPFDMAGTASDCPACGGIIEVPYISEPGTIWGAPLPDAGASSSAGAATPLTPEQAAATHDAMKSRTIRIELPDDI
jgi:nucleoid DNA-binding protein/DNA-directed RNA polymerase subunit RPC12/RpoP